METGGDATPSHLSESQLLFIWFLVRPWQMLQAQITDRPTDRLADEWNGWMDGKGGSCQGDQSGKLIRYEYVFLWLLRARQLTNPGLFHTLLIIEQDRTTTPRMEH